jgi:hypothetical protein
MGRNKVFILQCTTCDYLIRIKNPTDALIYRTLQEDQSGHTGMLLSEEGKKYDYNIGSNNFDFVISSDDLKYHNNNHLKSLGGQIVDNGVRTR